MNKKKKKEKVYGFLSQLEKRLIPADQWEDKRRKVPDNLLKAAAELQSKDHSVGIAKDDSLGYFVVVMPLDLPEIRVQTEKSLYEKVRAFFNGNDEKTQLWFKTSNPLLGGMIPDYMLKSGHEVKLETFINNSLDENKLE